VLRSQIVVSTWLGALDIWRLRDTGPLDIRTARASVRRVIGSPYVEHRGL